jgi:hypothetical protein
MPQLVWLSATLFCCALLTFYGLTSYPFAVHGDVGEILTLGAELQSPWELFLPSRWWGIPGLMLLPSWLGSQLEFSLFAARLPDATLGVLSGLALFALAIRSLRPAQSFLFVLLITSSPQVLQTTRLGVGQVPPWLFTVLYCLLACRIWERSGRPKAAGYLLGVLGLLSFFIYLPARALSVLFAVQVAAAVGASVIKREWRAGAIFASYAIVPVVGFLIFLLNSPDIVPRSSYLYHPASGWTLQSILTDYIPHVTKNSLLALGSLIFIPGTANGDFYLSDAGFFDPLTILLGITGCLAMLCRRSSVDARTPFYIMIISALTLGGIQEVTPAYNRLTPMYCAFAIIALEGWRLCSVPSRRWAGISLSCLAIAQIAWNATQYFTYTGVANGRWWSERITALSYYLRDHAPPGCFIVADTERLGFYGNHGTLRLIAGRQGGVDAARPESCARIAACGEFLIVSAEKGSKWQSAGEAIDHCGFALVTKEARIVQPGILVTAVGFDQ